MQNANFLGKKRCIDIIFCIDGTGSMSPCIESVKENARRFYTDFVASMTDLGSEIDSMRVKVIVFRDYKSDEQEAMLQSPFYELPADDADFSKYLLNITAKGGCNEDANGLEALFYAMTSDFSIGTNDRQIIVLFADTTAIPLRERNIYPNYPNDMVDYNGLLETWMCIQGRTTKLRERNKRLVIFAPANTIYEDIKRKFNRSVFEAVEIHKGLDGIAFKDIIKIIAASASSA